ncbi:MAG: hypothetical protein CMJ80_16980 [Planctomycetaceae bacterium]|nr:hypothetical protein [Planctomycetaceae bacterium]
MFRDESHEERRSEAEEIRFILDQQEKQTKRKDELAMPPTGYLVELSGQAISLDVIEFEILRFLSKRPYKPYTRRQIASAISTPHNPVEEGELDRHVMSLRGKLGQFSDYIQSVPYVGYRFKA